MDLQRILILIYFSEDYDSAYDGYTNTDDLLANMNFGGKNIDMLLADSVMKKVLNDQVTWSRH